MVGYCFCAIGNQPVGNYLDGNISTEPKVKQKMISVSQIQF